MVAGRVKESLMLDVILSYLVLSCGRKDVEQKEIQSSVIQESREDTSKQS